MSRQQAKDLYKELGVSRDADASAIKKAYRKLAQQYHPDRNADNAQAEDRFKRISAAYTVLSDEKRRRDYDEFGEIAIDPNFDADKARRAAPGFGGSFGQGFGGGFGNSDFSGGQDGGFGGALYTCGSPLESRLSCCGGGQRDGRHQVAKLQGHESGAYTRCSCRPRIIPAAGGG